MLSRLVKSACIWYVYFPHLTMLRWVGPRAALLFTRGVAWIHWLLTLVGGHGTARRAMTAALPGLWHRAWRSGRSLRRYLAVKHQRFVEWYLFYPTARGRRFVARTYRDVDGREHLDAALAEGNGVVLLVFHFGMAKMVFPALQALGYDNYHHVFRGATYADETFAPVAKAAMDALATSEEQSGLKVIYHRPNYTFATMVRHLRNGAIVGMNGDGMMGTEFVTLPFLGGTMPFPTGPARLSGEVRRSDHLGLRLARRADSAPARAASAHALRRGHPGSHRRCSGPVRGAARGLRAALPPGRGGPGVGWTWPRPRRARRASAPGHW